MLTTQERARYNSARKEYGYNAQAAFQYVLDLRYLASVGMDHGIDYHLEYDDDAACMGWDGDFPISEDYEPYIVWLTRGDEDAEMLDCIGGVWLTWDNHWDPNVVEIAADMARAWEYREMHKRIQFDYVA